MRVKVASNKECLKYLLWDPYYQTTYCFVHGNKGLQLNKVPSVTAVVGGGTNCQVSSPPRIEYQLHLCHMEYSMWHEKETPWSTPCGHDFMPHGGLHMVIFGCHMEYFRIHQRGQFLLSYGVLHMAAF